MTNIGNVIASARRQAGLSQHALAERAGTSQPAIARLEQGHSSPSVVTLERLAAAAGFAVRIELLPAAPPDPVIEAYKRDVDRTLLRENLRKTVDERLKSLDELREFDAEIRRGVRRTKPRR